MRKTAKTPFAVTLWYLLLYGFVRFFVEGIRTDPLMLGTTGIRASQLLSALMMIGAIILLPVLRQRRLKREFSAALSASMAFRPDQSDKGDPVSDLSKSLIRISRMNRRSRRYRPMIKLRNILPKEQTEDHDD